MSELRWAYPLLSMISLLSFLDIFLMWQIFGNYEHLGYPQFVSLRKPRIHLVYFVLSTILVHIIMSTIKLDHIELLTGPSNYESWKRGISQVLQGKGYWGHVEGDINPSVGHG
jgi:gag-polypeptide of LTR copia-type